MPSTIAAMKACPPRRTDQAAASIQEMAPAAPGPRPMNTPARALAGIAPCPIQAAAAAVPGPATAPPPAPRVSSPVDIAELRRSVGDDLQEVAETIMQIFAEDAPGRMAAIEQAMENGDRRAVRATAHAYRGAAATVRAPKLAHLLGEIETAADEDRLANARELLPSVRAARILDEPVQVDGRLDDPAWARAELATGFLQNEPVRGALPTEEATFKVLYDDDAIYFGVACYEKDPSKTQSSLARRDHITDSDLVSIYIDPYLDRTTGYNFRVNPKGVLVDAYMFNDGDRDQDWDAVWEAETYMDDDGWYTEMRIPFSSIRYRPAESMTWGLQVYRYMHGRGEDTAWVTWDRNAKGFVSRFGQLTGLSGIRPPRQLEIMPYVVSKATDPAALGAAGSPVRLPPLPAPLAWTVEVEIAAGRAATICEALVG